ncbi:MAG: site-2 protease family protein [Myxococcales bacterium]|nr:site-2 protease family protein [Myxococcales bacterium]
MFVIGAILLLSVLIIVHEFGHYIFAVATGMRVDRFSVIGIGPPIAKLFTYKGTEFVISAIPFGAYVHIVGMEAPDDEELAEEERARAACLAAGKEDETKYLFRNRPVWARIATIFGGPLANYLAAMLIFFSLFTIAGTQIETAVRVDDLMSDSAKASGLEEGDELVAIAGESVQGRSAMARVRTVASKHSGATVDVTVNRAGEEKTLPVPISEEGRLGILLDASQTEWIPMTAGVAAKNAVVQPLRITEMQLTALGGLIVGRSKAEVGGPVAIVDQIRKSAKTGMFQFFWIGAVISTVLGMINLLPIPALDGGRLVFLVYEMIARRPANRRIEEMVHGVGMLALLGLILLVTIRDIGKFFS